MLIVADVMLDVIAEPNVPLTLDAELLDHAYGRTSMRLGGSGSHIALHAVRLGLGPVRLAVAGADPPGIVGPLATLRAAGVDLIVNPSPRTVGTAVITYLNDQERIMLVDPGASATQWSEDTINQLTGALDDVGVLVVSGHALFRDATRAGTERIMRAAVAAQVPVALDLVPHSVHRSIPAAELTRLLQPVDVLAAAADTLLAYAGSRRTAPRDYAELPAVVEKFLEHHDTLLVQLPDRTCWVVDSHGRSTVRQLATANGRTALTDRFMVEVLAARFCGWREPERTADHSARW
ncbi:carbohydrate kinase family protein [Micromonospora sp. WMMD1120]|uniref:carbohydrate kinase family protein n=1 Tax=Micromonospora sp. WMMD1120 TaxID=3016106 RepID=UPI002415EB02|nr:carbohydrate kinase family protein [Micromonospora sp. WMMD1120]MDG4808855.1 carbohydrate kinase family protein [Micromonospora sp. WMMD1120]